MSLAAGTRLGPYELLDLIGAGGMGEVYQARDTRLDRTVAIKILPADIADGDRRSRFEREARVIAALDHPHICTLYDVGEHERSLFLVMEHLVGQTLATRLQKGPLHVDQAVEIAAQIADALDAAHQQGIIHRDLTPANVMLTRAGVKLLDFGLAKLKGRADLGGLAAATSLRTAAEPLTTHGMILGTMQYMAPEQLEGKEADARADLWALGAILYEMVSGRRAFDGASSASVIAAVLDREPAPLGALQPLVPVALDELVTRCLEKDPGDRWDSAHDVELQLARMNGRPPGGRRPRASPHLRRALVLLAVTACAATIGFVGGRRVPPGATPAAGVTRLPVSAKAGIAAIGSESSVAVSADGRLIAFLGTVREATAVFLRRLANDETVPLEGTTGATSPFFSPDGRWLGVFQEGKLKKIPVDGGVPQTIADAPTGRGAVWRADGTIFFAPQQSGPLFQVPADGGNPRPITTLDSAAGENSHRFPELLPGGDVLLFTVRIGGGFENAQIATVRLSSGERKTLVRGGVHGRYLSTGHLMFAKGTTLMAEPFDVGRLEGLGSPAALLEGIRYSGIGGVSDFAVSDTGTLVYAPASLYSAPVELVRVSRAGVAQLVIGDRLPFRDVSLSPNGRFIAVTAGDGDRNDLSIVDLARRTLRPLLRESRNETPFWSPDGTRVIFSSNRRGQTNLFSLRLDRADEPQVIRQSPEWNFATSVTPDGRGVLYGEVNAATGWDIWLQSLDGSGAARKLLGASSHERYARLSPDGRAMAFVSDESGRNEVYVVAYPIGGERIQVSTSGGSQPVWAHSGRELFYRADDALVAVPMHTAPYPSAGAPAILFRGPLKPSPPYALTYDVMPDDREFVMLRASGADTTRVNVVLNWFEELKARVPPKR